jgi:hypothetical protein
VALLGVFLLLLGAGRRAYDMQLQRKLERAARLNREQADIEADQPGQ